MITPQQAIERLISNNELFYDEMTDLMRQIMSGQVPPEQIAAILTGLRIKVETVSEITAAAALYAGNVVPSLADGVKAAEAAIDSGKAKAKKEEFIRFTQQFAKE